MVGKRLKIAYRILVPYRSLSSNMALYLDMLEFTAELDKVIESQATAVTELQRLEAFKKAVDKRIEQIDGGE